MPVPSSVNEALVVVDSEYRVLSVNKSFCRLFHSSPQDTERRPFFGRGAAQFDAPQFQDLLDEVLSKETAVENFEIDQQSPVNGRQRLVLNARKIETSGTILIPIEDITERKKAEDKLQRSEFTIRSLLESAPQSVIAVSTKETIVLANGNTEKMFGYRQAELLGQPLSILIPESARGRHAEHQRSYFANMQSRSMGIGLTLEARRKDGTTFPVEIGLSAIETAAAGKLAVAFISDITERRRLEEVAQTHAQQVNALAARLLTAQEEERRRVSRELHDQICQQLASLAIDIGGLATNPPPPGETKNQLKTLQARVVKTSEETRHIALSAASLHAR